ASRLYMLAAVLSSSGTSKRRVNDSSTANVDDLPGVFNDLKIRLEHTFHFTTQQRVNICTITQDLIYQPDRIEFKMLFMDLMERLEQEKDKLRLTNVFGNPWRVKQLTGFARDIASSVRNSFRSEICASIVGDKRCSLKEFTYRSAMKFKLGGAGTHIELPYTAHNAILV
ncbi:hypothetical protein FKP32DRAFT_1557433, partial [Trametes sanguinea]